MNNSLTNKIAITTTRKPPSRVRQLVNELLVVIPNSFKIIRGHANLQDITENAFSKSCSKIILISSNHGNPTTISGYKINPHENNIKLEWNFDWIVKNVKLKQELGTKKVKNSTDNIQLTYINIISDIKENIDDYFNFSKTIVNENENQIKLILEYSDPGFLFFPQNTSNEKFSPIIAISEIILPDKAHLDDKID